MSILSEFQRYHVEDMGRFSVSSGNFQDKRLSPSSLILIKNSRDCIAVNSVKQSLLIIVRNISVCHQLPSAPAFSVNKVIFLQQFKHLFHDQYPLSYIFILSLRTIVIYHSF